MENSTKDPHIWPWPDFLDALVAAPDHHMLFMENERVRVLETLIPPGETTPVHTHRWPSVYVILSWSDFLRTDDQGNVMADSRQSKALAERPSVLWGEALPPHALENVGDQDLRLISVELKEPSS
jgi:mannose-6-phosphate isomerase-like protein (cupin superfamily)